ncbi:MAG: RluA family pseudouridine synthase, partial [Erysipelotrichaceae bacterium]|nr:RluA family pseudouridine synthase [Erysipelotrichaceae bacterium]
MKVIFEDNHLLVIEKPVNVPMQADSSKDEDLLTMAKAYIKKKYDKPGEVYLGLVHRLDRPVGGVCVFARTSKAAARLSKQIADHEFQKTYLAVVQDHGLSECGHFEDLLYKDPKTNMVKVDPRGKKASLDYKVLKRKDDLALVEVDLHTGRSHQIRVQHAHAGYPLWGDARYGGGRPGQQIGLWAYELGFEHPVKREPLRFTSSPPKAGVWVKFQD